MIKKLIALIAISFLFTFFAIGQGKKAEKQFTELVNQDSITISYRWKSMPNTQNKGPLKLDLRIENKCSESKEISFVVDVFQNLIIFASSEKQTYCVSPHKIMFGDKKYSSYDVSELNPDDLKEEIITIDLSELQIRKVEVCE